jgi:sulfur-oxidizing protein SoxY
MTRPSPPVPAAPCRRQVVQALATGGLVAAMAALPATARASARNEAAFSARTLEALYKALGLQAGGPADGISLNAPEVAENGANVPIEIKVALPGLQRILLIGERNAYPLLLDLAWSAPGPAALDLRIKLGESAPLRVIAVAGGKVHSAVRMVRVTVGGCAVS